KAFVLAQVEADAQHCHEQHTLWQGLSSSRVWLLSALYFALVQVTYGYTLWLPKIIQSIPDLKSAQVAFYAALPLPAAWASWLSGRDDFWIGFLSAIPGVATVIAMVVVGKSSDRTGERRWHIALSAVLGA